MAWQGSHQSAQNSIIMGLFVLSAAAVACCRVWCHRMGAASAVCSAPTKSSNGATKQDSLGAFRSLIRLELKVYSEFARSQEFCYPISHYETDPYDFVVDDCRGASPVSARRTRPKCSASGTSSR